MEDLSDTQMLDLNKTMKTMLPILKKTLKPDGFNIGLNLGRAAGAGIDKHLHMHIVPRWFGDTNFMPVTAATKIISQSLDQLHDLLRKNIHPVRDAKNNLNTGN
jgi:ATP adenylyltransferase